MLSEASSTPMIRPGIALPSRISVGVNGVTSNWSKVPCSRSRATDKADTVIVTTKVNRPTMPGTINQRLSRFGLNQARSTSSAGGRPDRGWPPNRY